MEGNTAMKIAIYIFKSINLFISICFDIFNLIHWMSLCNAAVRFKLGPPRSDEALEANSMSNSILLLLMSIRFEKSTRFPIPKPNTLPSFNYQIIFRECCCRCHSCSLNISSKPKKGCDYVDDMVCYPYWTCSDHCLATHRRILYAISSPVLNPTIYQSRCTSTGRFASIMRELQKDDEHQDEPLEERRFLARSSLLWKGRMFESSF